MKKVMKYAPLKTEFARAVASDESVKTIKMDEPADMLDAPNEIYAIENEPDKSEEAPQGVDSETGEVKE